VLAEDVIEIAAAAHQSELNDENSPMAQPEGGANDETPAPEEEQPKVAVVKEEVTKENEEDQG